MGNIAKSDPNSKRDIALEMNAKSMNKIVYWIMRMEKSKSINQYIIIISHINQNINIYNLLFYK